MYRETESLILATDKNVIRMIAIKAKVYHKRRNTAYIGKLLRYLTTYSVNILSWHRKIINENMIGLVRKSTDNDEMHLSSMWKRR